VQAAGQKENSMKKILMAAVLGCMSGAAYAAGFGDLAVNASGLKALAGAQGIAVPAVPGYKASGSPVEFITLPGGEFAMGLDGSNVFAQDAKPVHKVTIKTFEISKTEVTVAQYRECVLNGQCTEPRSGDHANWGQPGRDSYPVNKVTWTQATQYAKFKNARLPSEAEWEYAARSGGKNWQYPWGNEAATCRRAVMMDGDDFGCGTEETMPVCSKPEGNTVQSLCDMAGNVREWVQDGYRESYAGAPVNGQAVEGGSERVLRGGSFTSSDVEAMWAGSRASDSDYASYKAGFRIAR
jgi:formylglycine-generating enzyme required for sulfatase activity